MASTEQLGRLAKAWRRAVEALPLLYDFVVPFLPPIAKYAMAGLLVVGGHDLYEEQFHYDESASALADKMYSRLDARIQEAEAALVAQYAEAGKKIAVVEAGLLKQHETAQQLQADFTKFAETAGGRLDDLAGDHKRIERLPVEQHARIERQLVDVGSAVEEVRAPIRAMNRKTDALWRELDGLPGKVDAHHRRLAELLGPQAFVRLRNEVLGTTAEVSRSPDLVVLRGGETKQIDFKVLQYDQGRGQYGLRDYSLRFAVEQTASPCWVRIMVTAENGSQQTLKDFCENESRALEHAPLTATLLYVKNNFLHKDLIVLAVVADRRAQPTVMSAGLADAPERTGP